MLLCFLQRNEWLSLRMIFHISEISKFFLGRVTMKGVLTVVLVLVVFSGCGGSRARQGTPVSLPPGPITIQNPIPYSPGNAVANNIKEECAIDQQLSHYIKEFGMEKGIEIREVAVLDTNGSGNNLKIEITHAISSGNAFIGHHKSTSIRGEFYDNGARLASFTGSRNSGGGAFAGFKGSCAVLGRTVKVLGEDIVNWLKQPSNNAHVGN